MNTFLRELIFPCGPQSSSAVNWILLVIRLIFGTLLLVHGIQKVVSYHTLSTTFADPIGLGSQLSLNLAIFAELICSLGIIFGFLFRLSLIPVIVTMFVAAFFALKGAPWVQRELPLSYLLVMLLLMVSGPGRYSLDTLVSRWLGWL